MKVITGLFEKPSDASRACYELESAGIVPDAISLIAGENVDRDAFSVEEHSKLAEGVAVGATMGGAVGAIVAGLTAVGAVATGGLGLIAAGPIVAALAGAGLGAAAGGSLGALIGAVIPEHEVKYYEDAIERGGVVVGVDYNDDAEKERIRDIFENCDVDKIAHK